MALVYGADGRLATVTADDGRTVSYGYSPSGHIASVTAADGAVSRYEFDPDARLTQIDDAEGRRLVTNSYDGEGRVSHQEFATGGAEFAYDLEAGTATVTNTATTVRMTYQHDAAGRLVRLTDAD